MLRLKCPSQDYAWGRKGTAECEVRCALATAATSETPFCQAVLEGICLAAGCRPCRSHWCSGRFAATICRAMVDSGLNKDGYKYYDSITTSISVPLSAETTKKTYVMETILIVAFSIRLLAGWAHTQMARPCLPMTIPSPSNLGCARIPQLWEIKSGSSFMETSPSFSRWLPF